MAIQNLAELIKLAQQKAFYEAGGGKQSEGQQIGEALGTVGKGFNAVNEGIQSGQKTAEGELMLQKMAQQMPIDIQKAQLENAQKQQAITPITDTLVSPQMKSTLGQAQQDVPTPQGGFRDWDQFRNAILGQRQQGIDTATQQALTGQQKYGNMTPDEYSKITAGGLRDVQTQAGQQAIAQRGENVWVTPDGKHIFTDESQIPADLKGSVLKFSKEKATPAVLKNILPQAGGITQDQIQSTIDAVKSGRMALSQLPGFGQNSLKGRVIAALTSQDPSFSFMKNESDFQAIKDYTRYINSPTYQNTIKYLESIQPNLDEVVRLSDSLDKTRFPLLNRAKLAVMGQTGDPDTKAFAAAATEVADQLAKILQGGGTGSGTSDAKINQALSIFNGDFSPEQFKAVANEMKTLLGNRQGALEADTVRTLGMARNPKADVPHTQKTETAQTVALPPDALSKVKNALGSPVNFGNGQSWHWDNAQGKAVRDK